MHSFYTQFDKNFLSRTLALHRSLEEHCTVPFTHYLLCLDDASYKIMQHMPISRAVLLRLEDIETSALLEAKQNRTLFEYYWTVGPSGLKYVLDTYKPDTLAYLDGDMCFYSSPTSLFNELGEGSVLLFPHRLPQDAKVTEEEVGRFNVGGLLFRNNTSGRAALTWWAESCITWCYDRIELGRYGDQKYLDEFPSRFEGVHVSTNKGADTALWNIANSNISQRASDVYIDTDKLVFYHFAKLKYYYPLSGILPRSPLSAYTLPSIEKRLIYTPYLRRLSKAIHELEQYEKPFSFGSVPRPSLYKQLKNIITGWLAFGVKSGIFPVL